jgi:hypothetical protein
MFFSLLNLFGEFPLVSEHSTQGRFVAVFVAIFAVAIFGIPVGILGDGFGDAISDQMETLAVLRRKRAALKASFERADADGSGTISSDELFKATSELGYALSRAEVSDMALEADLNGDGSIDYEEFSHLLESRFKGEFRLAGEAPQNPPPGHAIGTRAMIYRFLNPGKGPYPASDTLTRYGQAAENLTSVLIILNVAAFAWSTTQDGREHADALEIFEWFSVAVFSLEWAFRFWASPEERRFAGPWGRLSFLVSYPSLLDLSAILPTLTDPFLPGDFPATTFIRALRLLRLVRSSGSVFSRSLFRYMAVVKSCLPTFKLTLAIAMVTWVISSVLFYYTERYNPDPDMRRHYRSVPRSMWITLLNLSGEAPLCKYQWGGRIVSALVGLFATAFFAIPVGSALNPKT